MRWATRSIPWALRFGTAGVNNIDGAPAARFTSPRSSIHAAGRSAAEDGSAYGRAMKFDRLTAALLVLRDDAPDLNDAEAEALQNAHMAHLADLHEAGHLLAAGPLVDGRFRGLSILNVEPDEALRLKEQDPAVRAGRFDVLVMSWIVPGGAMSFARTHFPRSTAEVD